MRNSTTSTEDIWKRMEVFVSFCFFNCHCRKFHWHALTQRLLKELQYREQFFITAYSIQNANTNSTGKQAKLASPSMNTRCKLFLTRSSRHPTHWFKLPDAQQSHSNHSLPSSTSPKQLLQ